MKLFIDGVEYHVNGKKVMEHLSAFYIRESEKMQEFDLGEGKKLDFGRKSLLRIAMKAAMVPFVVPLLGLLYKLRGLPPPQRKKHEDMLEWMVLQILSFGSIIEEDIVLHAYTENMENNDGNVRLVKSVSTYGTDVFHRNTKLELTAGGEQEISGDRISSGEAYVRGREDGYGEDNVLEEVHTDEGV